MNSGNARIRLLFCEPVLGTIGSNLDHGRLEQVRGQLARHAALALERARAHVQRERLAAVREARLAGAQRPVKRGDDDDQPGRADR